LCVAPSFFAGVYRESVVTLVPTDGCAPAAGNTRRSESELSAALTVTGNAGPPGHDSNLKLRARRRQ
jgi:hypothetical protein